MSLSNNAEQMNFQNRIPEWAIIIGTNTGGPQALAKLLPQFPAGTASSIIVVQQMRPGFTRVLAEQFNQICNLPVCEPEDGQAVQSSKILIAQSDCKLKLISNDDNELWPYSVFLEEYNRQPGTMIDNIDCAMGSAAKVFGCKTIGVLLTGLGTDGCDGMRSIRDAGGFTIVQDEMTSVVHSLPASAIDAGVVQEILPLWSIADRIMDIIGGSSNAAVA